MKTKKTNRYGNGLKKFGLCAFTAALISVNVCQPYIYPVYADDVQEESSAGQENTDIEESGAQAGIETMYISTVDDFIEFAANCYIDSWSVNKKIVLRNNLDFTGRELVMVPVLPGNLMETVIPYPALILQGRAMSQRYSAMLRRMASLTA